ncbi:MAG TPA: LacI family DNA-binding transcriptional regulator [Aggregatilineales bacterium]|nr:LacI family DNA-binding transcriptional regulator [Aggregatilineales bacterium]
MATIKDVARAAGVSVSTVSHALSGHRPVRDETRARIFQAIAELGYQPSSAAQSLVTGRSHTVGILFPLEGGDQGDSRTASLNTIQLEMIMEANAVVQSRGYALHLYTQAEDEVALKALCRMCDGLLLATVRLEDPRVEYLMQQDYPFVVLGRTEHAEGVPWVDTDFEHMIYQQIAHLVERKHREIVFLDRPERLFREHLGYSVRARHGYEAACKRFGLQPVIYACDVSVEDGRMTMHKILDAHPTLTALAAFNDVAAVGAYYALPERGLKVPQDFSVITFTSPGFLRATTPNMTAMNNTGPLVSQRAAEMLMARLLGEKLTASQVLIKSELIPGETTNVAPAQRMVSARP